jgi:hypothetical protein
MACSVQIEGQYYCFQPSVTSFLDKEDFKCPEFKDERTELKEWNKAIKRNKRHLSIPYNAYVLRRAIVSLLSLSY